MTRIADILYVNPSDDHLKPAEESSIFYPYFHHDYYGMDTLFLSPFQPAEVWNLQNVLNVHPAILAFLTLRSFLLEEVSAGCLELTGLSRVWKTYLAKTGYFSKNPHIMTNLFVPEIVSDSETPLNEIEVGTDEKWTKSLRWEYADKTKKMIFFVAAGRHANLGTSSLSELLSQFLVNTQKFDRLAKAYIRKETSSYLYLQTEDQIHPRVFFRENAKEMPEFLLFIAELIPK